MAKMMCEKTLIKEVKPTIVNLGFSIKSTGSDPKEVINNLNEIRKLCKEFIISKKSYKQDSYSQSNINFRKIMKKEVCYRHKQNPSKTISADLIDKLNANEIDQYEKISMDIFDGYEATTIIEATLNNSETVIEDFTDILNMCIDKEIYCTYKHDITAEERKQYDIQISTDCINEIISEAKDVINGLNIESNNFKVLEIKNGFEPNYKYTNAERTSSYKPEVYLIPELVKELFNNNIRLSKSLQLTILF